MTENKQKISKRIYIEETLNNRKYFSYRLDLILVKMILVIIFFTLIMTITSHFVFALIVSIQIFILFSLINKKTIDKRKEKGKILIINEVKKNYFENKIFKMKEDKFAEYIKLILLKNGQFESIKIENDEYATGIQNKNTTLIKMFFMYKGAIINSIDIRDFIRDLLKTDYKNALTIIPHEIEEEALNTLKKLEKGISIKILRINELFELTNNLGLLPENINEYYKMKKIRNKKEKISIIKENIFEPKKIIIYGFAALFFYFINKITNSYNHIIAYYFVVLFVINIIYNLIKINKTKKIQD